MFRIKIMSVIVEIGRIMVGYGFVTQVELEDCMCQEAQKPPGT